MAYKELNTTYFCKMIDDDVCNICGHNWAVHNTVKSPCTVCDKIFRNKKHLAVHISNTHAENKRFPFDLKSGENACSYYSTTKKQFEGSQEKSARENY